MSPGQIGTDDRGPARVLTISNPPRKGAVSAAMLERIAQEAERASREGVRALVLTGDGRGTFCAGYDISALPDTPATELPDAPLLRACEALEACEAPVIAAIDGPAMGAGFELACACDFRIAGAAVKLSVPPAKLGLVYSPEGTWRVVRTVGLDAARDLLLRALTIDAQRAGFEIAEDPLAEALKRAGEIAALAPRSIAGLKASLRALTRAPLGDADRAKLEAIRREAFASDDAREGRAAFLERRAPKWSGK